MVNHWILEHDLSQEDHGKMMAESIVGIFYITVHDG